MTSLTPSVARAILCCAVNLRLILYEAAELDYSLITSDHGDITAIYTRLGYECALHLGRNDSVIYFLAYGGWGFQTHLLSTFLTPSTPLAM